MKDFLKFIIFFAIILISLYFLNKYEYLNVEYLLNKIKIVKQYRLLSIILIILLYFISGFIYIPIAQFSIISGIIFNVYLGALIAYVGSIINIMIAFIFARFLLYDFFMKFKGKIKLFDNIMSSINKNGKYYILWARLFFITPYNSLNIISALSNISIKDFFLTTLIGSSIQAIFYAYIGSIFLNIEDRNFIKISMVKILIVVLIFFIFLELGRKLALKYKKNLN
jgi:uncharacterized membrane protein YdjX (TVP38/TMEM64 family)